MTISKKLKLIMRLTGFTQERLARELQVTFATVNSWINDKSLPRVKTGARIEALFLRLTGQNTVTAEQLNAKRREIARYQKVCPDVRPILKARTDIYDQLLLSFTYNTNSIEGSTLTEPETAALLFDKTVLPDKTLVEQMEVRNHQAAFGFMVKTASGTQDLSEDFILRLHGILMNGITTDAGEYRTHGVRIVGANVPTANHLKVPVLVRELAGRISETHDGAVRHAVGIHAGFERIHPFSDGNGRVGRLVLAAMLLRAGFAPAIVRQELKRYYLMYLQQAQMHDDFSRLEDFMLDGILAGYGIVLGGE